MPYEPTAPPREAETEREFYLREFRGRTLVIALAASAACREVLREIATVIDDLLDAGSRVLVVAETSLAAVVRERLARSSSVGEPVAIVPEADCAALARLCHRLRHAGAAMAGAGGGAVVRAAAWLAARLRAAKLVLLEEGGGLRARDGRLLSFVDGGMLAALVRHGQAEWEGLGERRVTLTAVRQALEAGVPAVNLCAPGDLDRELFSYEGAGTLFTREDYCAVDRLGIDDFDEAERLLVRGEREGFLKPRTSTERLELLLQGFGARIGAERHLAGVCALLVEPYAGEGCAEVAALYTITRFKAEGVGRHLLARVESEATALGLRYLFACTLDERARAFFERAGFAGVGADAVPAGKWQGYPEERRRRVLVCRKVLSRG